MPSPEFFHVLPVADALALLDLHWQPDAATERIAVADALDRVSAHEIRSPEALPAFRKSTVDGYALRAADTFGASQTLPALLDVIGEIKMGERPAAALGSGQALTIHTGGMLPAGADAAIMIEHTQVIAAGEIEAMRAVAPGENVIQVGEDVAAGAPVLPGHHRLRAADIGSLLALGIEKIEVLRAPRLGILSCGDELLPPSAQLTPGKVRDINAYTLSALAQSLGATPSRQGIARDSLADYRARAAAAFAQSDMLLLSAGSSVSARDYTRDVINSLGAPGLLQHGLATKPGKPTIIAVCAGKPVIGLPGNPVSALLVARQLLPHLIARYLGQKPQAPPLMRARLALRVASETGREDWLPVRLRANRENTENLPLAEPIYGKSNLIFTLARADALLRVPLNSSGLEAGSLVDVSPL